MTEIFDALDFFFMNMEEIGDFQWVVLDRQIILFISHDEVPLVIEFL